MRLLLAFLLALPLLAFDRPVEAAAGDLAWRTRASMAYPRMGHGLAVQGGKLYAIGGVSGTDQLAVDGFPSLVVVHDVVEEYDPARNVWRERAPMPTARKVLGVTPAPNGRLYAVGGSDGYEAVSALEEYDPRADSWRSLALMPTPRGGLGAAFLGGKLYVAGGQNESGALATFEEYDPATDRWTARRALTTARFGLALVAVGSKLYAVGGDTAAGGFLATVEEYDPATDTWRARAPLPYARAGMAAAELGGQLYVMSGCCELPSWRPFANVDSYDPQTDRWTARTPLGTIRIGAAGASLNGKLYAVGGQNRPGSQTPLPQTGLVEEGTPPAPPPPPSAPKPQQPGRAERTLSIFGSRFTPRSLSVKVGTTVTWKNGDRFAHTVTGTDFDSAEIAGRPTARGAQGGSFSQTFTKAGSYAYYCKIHRAMRGTIIVR